MILAGTCVLATQHLLHACNLINSYSAEQLKRIDQDKLWILCHVSVAALVVWGRGQSWGGIVSTVTELKTLFRTFGAMQQRYELASPEERLSLPNMQDPHDPTKLWHILMRAFSSLLAFGVFAAAPQIVAVGLGGRALLNIYYEYNQAKCHNRTYGTMWTVLAIQLILMTGAWYASPLLIAAAVVVTLVRQRNLNLLYKTVQSITQACGFN